jgi:hypothetical protein
MLYYVYFSDNGSPKTGLSLTWHSLRAAGSGADKTALAPIISSVGGGWYQFDITFGVGPWNVTTEDLVGVIDGGSSLAAVDRYKPVCLTLRGLALARIAHKGVQDKLTGGIDIYASDGESKELRLDMSEDNESVTREPMTA